MEQRKMWQLDAKASNGAFAPAPANGPMANVSQSPPDLSALLGGSHGSEIQHRANSTDRREDTGLANRSIHHSPITNHWCWPRSPVTGQRSPSFARTTYIDQRTSSRRRPGHWSPVTGVPGTTPPAGWQVDMCKVTLYTAVCDQIVPAQGPGGFFPDREQGRNPGASRCAPENDALRAGFGRQAWGHECSRLATACIDREAEGLLVCFRQRELEADFSLSGYRRGAG